MSHPLHDLDGIGPELIARLKKAGIRTTGRLLEAASTYKARKVLAEKIGIDEKTLLAWANMSDRMRIKGVGEDIARLLQAAGVDTVKELKHRNPANLAKAMAAANAKRKLMRMLPSETQIARLIENAKKLDIKIRY